MRIKHLRSITIESEIDRRRFPEQYAKEVLVYRISKIINSLEEGVFLVVDDINNPRGFQAYRTNRKGEEEFLTSLIPTAQAGRIYCNMIFRHYLKEPLEKVPK